MGKLPAVEVALEEERVFAKDQRGDAGLARKWTLLGGPTSEKAVTGGRGDIAPFLLLVETSSQPLLSKLGRVNSRLRPVGDVGVAVALEEEDLFAAGGQNVGPGLEAEGCSSLLPVKL